MNKNTSENIYKYIFNISDVVWATNQKWKHYGYLMAERRWTLKHCQFIYFLQKCDSRGKISQAKHRKNHKSDFLSEKKKKNRFPEAWKVFISGHIYSDIEGGLAADSGHSYISGSKESYSLRHILSLMYLALSSGSGYRKAILLAYRYSVTWKIK